MARRWRSTTACVAPIRAGKAWDVVIEGISYVKSFRDDFSAEIDQKGLDEVIARLEAGESPSAIKGAAAGGKG
jgi:hypothetical protein